MESQTKKEWYENTWLYVIITVLGALLVIFNQGLGTSEGIGKIQETRKHNECVEKGRDVVVNIESEIDRFKEERMASTIILDLNSLREYAKCSERTPAELQQLGGLKDRILLLLGDVIDKEIEDAEIEKLAENEKNIVLIIHALEELCSAFNLCTGEELLMLNDLKSDFE